MTTGPPLDASSRAIVTLPNAISVARLATVPVFMWLFTRDREEAAVIVYGAGAVSDFLDGYVARRTSAVSDLGILLDPLADRIFVVALAAALVTRGALPGWLALGIIGRDVLLLACWPLVERRQTARIRVGFAGKAATALLLTGLAWLALGETTYALGRRARRTGLPLVAAGAGLYWAAAAGYARGALARRRATRQDWR